MIVCLTSFTTRPERWAELALALGGTKIVDGGCWQVFALAGGRLAIHTVEPDHPKAGAQTISFDVPDLSNFGAVNGVVDGQIREIDMGHGRVLEVTSSPLPNFFVEEVEGEMTHPGETLVAPLFYTPEVQEGARLIASLGLTARVSSLSGTYVDFADDGVVAVHHGTRGVGPSFEHPDVTALIEPLQAAGFRATLIDETYGRTLRVENPDDASVEAEIWINETQTDLYGYREGLSE